MLQFDRRQDTRVDCIAIWALTAQTRYDALPMSIARKLLPEYKDEPKMMKAPPSSVHVHDHSSTTNIAFGHLTDQEMETFDRLMRKAGIPEHLYPRRESIGAVPPRAPVHGCVKARRG